MAEGTTVGKLIVRVLMDAAGYDAEARKVVTSTSSMGKLMGKTADMIGGAFVTATKAATVALAGFAAASTVVGANFETAISKVAAVKGVEKTSEDFSRLEAEARRLGASTMFSASQAAAGMEELARAGLSTDEIISASQKVLELAAGSSISLADAASITASTMKQFGLEAEDTSRITDVLTATTQNSLFAMQDMAEAMKFAGVVGSGLGMSLEETSAAVAQFRNLGLQGSLAGTSFRMALTALAKPTAVAEAALKKYGLTIADVNPETRSFRDIMISIGEAGLSTGDAMTVFGKRAGGAALAVARSMAESSDDFDGLMSTLQNAAGTTTSTYEIMTDNVMGRFLEMKSAVEELMIGLFQTYAGPLQTLLGSITNFVRLVAEEVGVAAEDIGGSMADTLEGIAGFIDENAAGWASQLANIVKAGSEFASILSTFIIPALNVMLPLVDDIAIILATIWATQKVMAFTALITGVVIPAITATTFSLSGMAAALTAATGGLSALAAGLVVVATGLGVVISRLVTAREEANTFAEEQAQLTQTLSAQERSRERDARLALARSQMQARATLANKEAVAQLTDAQRQHFEAVVALTDSEAVHLVKQGKMIEVGGQLVSTENALNETLGPRGREAVLFRIEILEGNLSALRKKRAQVSGEAERSVQAEIERTQKRLRGLNDAVESQTKAGEKGAATTDKQAEKLRKLTEALKGTADAAGESSGATEKAVDATDGVIEKLRDQLAQVGLDAVDQAKFAEAKRRETINAAFEEQITAEKAQGERLIELRQQQEEALRLASLIEGKKTKEQVMKQEMSLALGVLSSRKMSGSMVEKLELNKAKVLMKLTHVSEATRAKVVASFDAEIGKERAMAETRAQDKLLEIQGKAVPLAVQLEREKADALIEFADASAETRAKIEEEYTRRIEKASNKAREALEKVFGSKAIQKAKQFGAAVAKVGSQISDTFTNLTGFSFNLTDAVNGVLDIQQQQVDAQKQAAEDLASAQEALDSAMQSGDTKAIEAARANLQEAQDALTQADESLAAGPAGFAEQFVNDLVDGAIQFIDMAIAAVGPLLSAVAARLPDLFTALAEAIPIVIDAIIENLPAIMEAIINGLSSVVLALVGKLPDIVTAAVSMIPDFILEIAKQLPDLIPAIILMIPEVAIALVTAVFTEIIPRLPEIAIGIIKGILEGLWRIVEQIVDGIKRAIGLGGKKDKKPTGTANLIASTTQAFSGMNYVPATMRVTVHPGEAIIPADRNPQGVFGTQGPAPAGASALGRAGGSSGLETVSIAVVAEGALLDAIQVRAAQRGRAMGVQRAVKRGTGVKIGFQRGKFSAYK